MKGEKYDHLTKLLKDRETIKDILNKITDPMNKDNDYTFKFSSTLCRDDTILMNPSRVRHFLILEYGDMLKQSNECIEEEILNRDKELRE